MPFPVSEWVVAQWGQTSYMTGDRMTKDDPSAHDARLGEAAYAFAAPDGHSHVWIFHDTTPDRWVYELYEQDGILHPGGGSNIFLTARDQQKDMTFDRPITYSVDLKLSQAEVAYFTPAAARNGAVVAMLFSGFSLQFADPQSGLRQSIFLQIPIARSGGVATHGIYIPLPTKGARPNLLYSAALGPDEPTLPFAPDPGPLHSFHYLLNRYLAQAVTRTYRWQGQTVAWPAAALDFRNWRLTGMYVGLETQASDLRPQSVNHDKQGSVKIGVQIANLRVMRDDATVFDSAVPTP